MNTHRRTVVVVLAAGALLAGCTATAGDPSPQVAPPPPPTSSTTSVSTPTTSTMPPPAPVQPPQLASANAVDPDSVARVVLLTMFTVDTTRDNSFSAGLRRAAPLLSTSYAASVEAAPTPTPDARWQTWTEHQAYTAASLTPSAEDRPADTDTTARRSYLLSYTPVGRDGWRGEPQQMVALVTLTHATGGWVVDQIDFR